MKSLSISSAIGHTKVILAETWAFNMSIRFISSASCNKYWVLLEPLSRFWNTVVFFDWLFQIVSCLPNLFNKQSHWIVSHLLNKFSYNDVWFSQLLPCCDVFTINFMFSLHCGVATLHSYHCPTPLSKLFRATTRTAHTELTEARTTMQERCIGDWRTCEQEWYQEEAR